MIEKHTQSGATGFSKPIGAAWRERIDWYTGALAKVQTFKCGPLHALIEKWLSWLQPMKIERHGRAKVLSPSEIKLLFSQGFTIDPPRDRALFAVCLYTACRINECVTLRTLDVFDRKLRVRDEVLIRKANTKGKLATRAIPVIEELRVVLKRYRPQAPGGYLFPGRFPNTHLHRDSASLILRQACRRLDLDGVSTHSFRRTALTQMSNAGIPLRVIQEISGHRTLDELYKYLEVGRDQVKGAVSSLSMLAAVAEDEFGKPALSEVEESPLAETG